MKKIINSLICTFLIVGSAFLAGCHDPEDTIDTLDLDRALSPLNFELTLEANVNATFTWTPTTSSRQYLLSLVKTEDGSTYREIKLTDDGSSTKMTYKFSDLPGNTKFRAELVALSTVTGNSKAVTKEFETGVEQLFLNDGAVADDDITSTTATMRWIPESNVTHLEVDNGIGRVDLDEDAIREGIYQLTGLTNGTLYTVNLCRDDAVRGTCTFVASDKATIEVLDKSGSSITVGWSEQDNVTSLKLEASGQQAAEVTLTDEDKTARKYRFDDLTAQTEYTITFFNEGVESGVLIVSTLGQATRWDFTTWEIDNWTESTTIDGMTFLADGTGKNIEIRADADFGVNYLDLRGKSTAPKDGAAPAERSLKFSVSEEGVLVIDCYANGSGRNFYVYSDQLGTSFGPVEAPVLSGKGKVYIPCPGVSRGALYIWTDATINHIYSIEWYAGSEAPGQNATPLDTPVVTASPASVTLGDQTEIDFSWGAIPNAVAYEWRIKLTYADESTETLSGETDQLSVKIDAAKVKALKVGTFSMNVTAKPEGEFKFKQSNAGSAVLTVSDTKLATPTVSFAPAKVTVGESVEATASWAAVEGAASYEVTFNNGAPETLNATSYTIPAATVAALAVGEYTISVVAQPAGADMEASDAGTAKLTVAEASSAGGDNFVWNFSDAGFDEYYAQIGEANNETFNAVWNGLTITSGKSIKCGTNSGMRYIQTGGAGSATQRCFSFAASASGKLKVVASNTGSSEDLTRMVTVAVNGNAVESLPGGFSSATPTACEFDLTISGGGTVTIYPTGNGLRFYSIEYTSEGGSGGGSGGDAGTAYSWGADDWTAVWAGFANNAGDINAAALETMIPTADLTRDADGFTYKGLSFLMGGGKFKFGTNNNAAGEKAMRFQFGGTGSLTKACVSFTVDAPGTLVVEAVSSSSSADRALGVSVDAQALTPQNALGSGATELTFDCSTAVNGSKISIYSTNGGINVFSIRWTPAN